MRTQEEIMDRFNKVDDLFGTQKDDLIEYLQFENAKQYLKPEYVQKVEAGEETWEVRTDAKAAILGYLDFAYGKAEDERGLSAGRSMLHFRSWIWLDDPEFYDQIVFDIDNYTNYGMSVLNKISKHYGFVRS